jgi:hypothetical protein
MLHKLVNSVDEEPLESTKDLLLSFPQISTPTQSNHCDCLLTKENVFTC